MTALLNPQLPAAAADAITALQVRNLSMAFTTSSEDMEALQDVNLSLRAQEFVCLLGPSGSGKSTLLRIVAGLMHPTEGEIIFSAGSQPRVSLVFQDANLMPWSTVIENVALPLILQGMDHASALQKAQDWIERIGLSGFEHAWPRELSGGMAQRVAIARSLVQNPDLLLLDEPFGSLDAITREKMAAELLRIWQGQRTTVLMVTHSISEALLLSDRVIVFSSRPGRVTLDLPVTLPRPRDDSLRYTPEFSALAKTLKKAIT